MSKRSRNKKNKAQSYKEPWELPEKPRMEKPQTEEPQAEEPQAEEPQTEEPQAEKPQTEEPQTEKPQVEGSQTEKPLPDKPKSEKRQRIIMIALIALAVVAVIAMTLVLLYNRWFKKPVLPSEPARPTNGVVPSAVIPSGPDPDATPDIITVEPLAGGERKSEDFFTVLIFGADEVSGLTDTIMVASYDVTNQKATVLSIPRDTLVNNIYLDKANKSINATYKQNGTGERGVTALKTEISRLLGFVPDFYITIDWELVGEMVEAIGGVEFEVPWRMKYDDPGQNLHIDLNAGLQTLDGEHAMQLVRWRKNNPGVRGGGDSSDLSRLNVQHDFLKAVLKQTLQPQNIVRIPDLIRLFNENVVSDLAVENMLWFGQAAVLGGLSADDVEFLTMPVYGSNNANARYYGKVCPITSQLLTIVNQSLNPYVEDVTIRQLDLIQMSADGNILSSTTGTLRNPSSGVFTYPDDPTESDPTESDPTESDPAITDPTESGPVATDPTASGPAATDPTESGPAATDPTESGPVAADPTESGPAATDPTESDPVATDPTESDPAASEPTGGDPDPGQTDDPPPETGPALPEVDGPDDGDWGYTPD